MAEKDNKFIKNMLFSYVNIEPQDFVFTVTTYIIKLMRRLIDENKEIISFNEARKKCL